MDTFEVVFSEEYSENIYIQYDSEYIMDNLGKNSSDARFKFESYMEKAQEGQIYIVLSTQKGLEMIMSTENAFSVSFENDGQINMDNYMFFLGKQNATSYIIEIGDSIILNGIHNDLLQSIKDYAYNEYLKKFKKEPHNISIKLSSESAKNVITNHKPDEDVKRYFFVLDYKPKFLNEKMTELKKEFMKLNPDCNLDFEFDQTKLPKMSSESFFHKIEEKIQKQAEEIQQIEDELEDELEEINLQEDEEEIDEEFKYYETLFSELNTKTSYDEDEEQGEEEQGEEEQE